MDVSLDAILHRRAVKCFDGADISDRLREQILSAASYAPSSFNLQPYKFYWARSPMKRVEVARLCMGQKPAQTASALIVAVADLRSLAITSKLQSEWMRASDFSEQRIRDYERNAKIGRLLFQPGPLGIFAVIKWIIFRVLNIWKVCGMPPLFRHELMKWATKSTSLACQNLMIASEALGMNTCPMEGFDGRRLLRYLGLSGRQHEVVMVIAIGKKAGDYSAGRQWRRPLDKTVVIL
jgi:nitroreductase